MLFDGAPSELPTATLRPRGAGPRLAAWFGGLQRWWFVRWAWFRPRILPTAVVVSSLAIGVGAARYTDLHSHRHRHRSRPLTSVVNLSSYQSWSDEAGTRHQSIVPGYPDHIVVATVRDGQVELTFVDREPN
jgi:hypothetical protein